MARVKTEQIIEHISSQIRRTLEIAVNETIPGADFDSRNVFRAFRRLGPRLGATFSPKLIEHAGTDLDPPVRDPVLTLGCRQCRRNAILAGWEISKCDRVHP
jgi:hypothetical protein